VIVGPDLSALAKGKGSIEAVPAALQALLCPWSLDQSLSGQILRCARTDASGRFSVDGLVPWRPAFHIYWMPDQGGDSAPVFALAGGPLGGPGEWTRLELTANVVEFGWVQGRLLLNGRPISGRVGWKGPTRSGGGEAGPDGRLFLEAVEVGEVTISALRSTGDPERMGCANS
jgi:hypothetical protein